MDERNYWRDLAICTGRPLFKEPLYVNKPNLPNRDRLIGFLDEMLAARWFSDGRLVRRFEAEVARIAGARHCIATDNGTRGLEIAIRALNLSGEVIVPSFTYAATAQALRWLNITPVFADVDARTHNLDVGHVERLITARTSGILGVHLWGQPCDIEALEKVALKHSVSLLFDAAHAFGSTYRGRSIGSFGAAEVFSFHATKFISTGEGGAVTTNDDALASRLRSARNFGFDSPDGTIDLGTNAKMSELSAAMGLAYLDSFDDLLAANRATYAHYRTELADLPGISLLTMASPENLNNQYVVTVIAESAAGLSRDEVLRILEAENIYAKRYFYPGCHRFLSSDSGQGLPTLPVTEGLAQTVLVLPGGASITRDEVSAVCAVLRLALHASVAIREVLSGGRTPEDAAL